MEHCESCGKIFMDEDVRHEVWDFADPPTITCDDCNDLYEQQNKEGD